MPAARTYNTDDPAADIILSVRDLGIRLSSGAGVRQATRDVSFDVRRGERIGIVGESGCGKTITALSLLRLLPPVGQTQGSIKLGTEDLLAFGEREMNRIRGRRIGMIFQEPMSALDPVFTVGEQVGQVLRVHGLEKPQAIRGRVLDMLQRVGIAAPERRIDEYPHQLSGGQKQRALIARALTTQPKLIVCDEVVAALDTSIRGDVLNLFMDLKSRFGLTYVFISHDLSVISHISDRVAVMYLGRFAESGPVGTIMEAPLHPYTRALLSAEPQPLPSHLRTDRRIILTGDIPSPLDPPSGCRFRTRCPSARERCADEVPAWRAVREDHWVACHFAGQV